MSVARSLLRGAALGAVVGLFVFGLLVFTDSIESEPIHRYLFVLGAGAGAIFGSIRPGDPRIDATGAVIWGIGAVVAGSRGGWGPLVLAAFVGALLAGVWLLLGESEPGGVLRWFRWGGLLSVLIVLALLPLIVDGGILGHDESAYAVKAQQWLDGSPGTGWSPHRAPALSLYAYPVLAAGGNEPMLRLVGLIGTIGLVVAVWCLARRLSSQVAAAFAAAGIAASPALLYRGTEFLSDVPSAALLVTCMVVVWREFAEGEQPSYGLLWVLPPALLAFYLRYQSILAFGLILLVILMLWWRKVRARPGPLLAAAGLGLVGLLPHFIQSVVMFGTPWGLLVFTSRVGGRVRLGGGLVDYAILTRWELGAFVMPVAVVVGIAGLVAGWRSELRRTRFLFLMIPAALQVLALGIISHGEPRFILFAVALVIVAGAVAFEEWLAGPRSIARTSTAWAMIVLLVGSLAFAADYSRRSVGQRSARFATISAATAYIHQVAESPCAVMTTYLPQVTFYSGCRTQPFAGADSVAAVSALEEKSRFMLLVEPGLGQPSEDALEALFALTSGPIVFDGSENRVVVAEFVD